METSDPSDAGSTNQGSGVSGLGSADTTSHPGPLDWGSADTTSHTCPLGWGSADNTSHPGPLDWGSADNTSHPGPLDWGSADSTYTTQPSLWGLAGNTSGDLCTSDDMNDEEGCPDMYKECNEPSSYYASQVTPEVYRSQTETYTKAAVTSLMQSPEYLRKTTQCTLCWCIWSEGMSSADCMECGGYTMERPCPICTGRCGQIWTRDVDMSHSFNEAHWEGSCGLPEEEQHRYMTSILMEDGTEESILDALQDLNTH